MFPLFVLFLKMGKSLEHLGSRAVLLQWRDTSWWFHPERILSGSACGGEGGA